MKPRDAALQAVLAVRFPPDWSPVFHEHRPYERTVFRWPPGVVPGQGVEPTGMIILAALGQRNEGMVDLHGGGCAVRADHPDVQAALDHVIKWIDR